MEENKNIPDKDFQDEEEEQKKKNKKVLIVVIIAVVLAIILILVLLLLLRFCKKEEPAVLTAEATESASGLSETTSVKTTVALDSSTSSGTDATSTGTTGEATTTTDEETTTSDEETTEEVIIAPTISIVIYEGPTYSPADSVCYYRIEATVTGTSPVSVVWSRDDSFHAFGPKKAQVNLHSPSETYNLIATATNAAGNATDSIFLSWGCNRPPVITEIVLMGDHFTDTAYTVSASASDPDGDVLSYSWSVSGGSVANPLVNPMIWTTPPVPSTVNITVTVSDGRGGTDTMTEPVEVTNINRAPELGSIVVREPGMGYPAANIYTDHYYDLFISASDPDGDPLTYSWTVSHGTLLDPSTNPSRWTTPYSAVLATLRVTVSDGRGGTAQTSTTVQVKYYLY